jgi:hypothetical protein
MADKEFITKAGLKERGWTDAAISRFVPEYDEISPNPQFNKTASIKLYCLTRIKEVERSNEFKEFKEFTLASDKRNDAVPKAAEVQKQNLLAEIKGWEIVVTSEPLDKVRCDAINAYNGHQGLIYEYEFSEIRFATEDSDQNFLDRITVNYLRHQLSDYGRCPIQLLGPTGKDEADKALRDKILLAIAERFPQLATECRRQVIYPDIIRSIIP